MPVLPSAESMFRCHYSMESNLCSNLINLLYRCLKGKNGPRPGPVTASAATFQPGQRSNARSSPLGTHCLSSARKIHLRPQRYLLPDLPQPGTGSKRRRGE